mmetsp:Transcript_6999/g.25753  ORF Transcript_6999/g.25753 Transcript_6999/m.25753 type:complete len:244 (+) Transcript_6999:2979-3710(+)
MRIQSKRALEELQTALHRGDVVRLGVSELLLDGWTVRAAAVPVRQLRRHRGRGVKLDGRQADERVYVGRLQLYRPLEREPRAFKVPELVLARADAEAHARGRGRALRPERPPVPLQRLRELPAVVEQPRLHEQREDVPRASILERPRGVDELLRGREVPFRELQVRASHDWGLLRLLAVRFLFDELRGAQQAVGFVKVVVASNLVVLRLAHVDVVRRERAQDRGALVLAVGVVRLDLWLRRLL